MFFRPKYLKGESNSLQVTSLSFGTGPFGGSAPSALPPGSPRGFRGTAPQWKAPSPATERENTSLRSWPAPSRIGPGRSWPAWGRGSAALGLEAGGRAGPSAAGPRARPDLCAITPALQSGRLRCLVGFSAKFLSLWE